MVPSGFSWASFRELAMPLASEAGATADQFASAHGAQESSGRRAGGLPTPGTSERGAAGPREADRE